MPGFILEMRPNEEVIIEGCHRGINSGLQPIPTAFYAGICYLILRFGPPDGSLGIDIWFMDSVRYSIKNGGKAKISIWHYYLRQKTS